MNQLDQLKQWTVVVADTGDFASIKAYAPQDATTNPSLILKAVQMPEYAALLDAAIVAGKKAGLSLAEQTAVIIDHLLVGFGTEILKIVPGRVSTEVDARLSFDTVATVEKARAIIALYEKAGIARERVLIKIASTWEGIKAAEVLEKEGIHCNLTLLFSLAQAIVCAEAKVRLISPFVGRIYDWYKAKTGTDYQGEDDPGVQSVHRIYAYYKKFGYATEVMGASFRNVNQIIQLAGCDLLTISPALLAQLQSTEHPPLKRKLDASFAEGYDIAQSPLNESLFRWMHNSDAMAVEKTAEGIRLFAADIDKLEAIIHKRIGQ